VGKFIMLSGLWNAFWCWVLSHVLSVHVLFSELRLGAHDILDKDFLQAVHCSRKQKPYWVGSSPGVQSMAGDQVQLGREVSSPWQLQPWNLSLFQENCWIQESSPIYFFHSMRQGGRFHLFRNSTKAPAVEGLGGSKSS